MREARPSRTAAYVAAFRALGECLPAGARLCEDPLGWRFTTPGVARLEPLVRRFPRATGRVLLASPLRRLLLWTQVRTRAIDDLLRDFVGKGGRQIVLLGAGFDLRAVRLAPELSGARVIEVDHPATQARKRAVLEAEGVRSGAVYLPWNFERDDLAALPAHLRELGLDPAAATFTVWEGVIPYLTEQAVESTLRAIRAYSGPSSRVLLHYIERRRIEQRTIFHAFVARVGEPLRFGWDPRALPEWLSQRGFELVSDHSDDELARALYADRWAVKMRGAAGRFAVAVPE